MRTFWRRILLLQMALLLSACSSTTLVYNRLDFLLPRYLDRYVELNRDQDQQLNRLLESFLQRHRRVHLPRYTDLLAHATDLLDRPLTVADIQTLHEQAEIEAGRLESETLDWMLQLGAELSENQVEEFIANLRKQQSKHERKYLQRSHQEYREEAYDELLDNLQEYLGRLSSAQRKKLQQASARLNRWDTLRMEERSKWLDKLEHILQREPGWQERVRSTAAMRYANSSLQYKAALENNLAVIYTTLAQLINSRSDQQDRYLRRKLQNLREDLISLVDQQSES